MFIDKKLNQYFNESNDEKFVNRMLHLAKKLEFEMMGLSESPVKDDCIEYLAEILSKHIQKRKGKIYIAYNDKHPTVIKIGRTSKPIEEREKSLNSAGVIGEIKIIGWCETPDTVISETFIHQRLKKFNTEKEFFSITAKEASVVINECAKITTDFYNKIITYYGV